MEKVAIFYNEFAAAGDQLVWQQMIREVLFRSVLEFYPLVSPAQLALDMDKIKSERTNVVICIGGDGTVNAVIQRLANTGIGLLVIGAGTANDFAREMGTMGQIENKISLIRKNQYKLVDLIQVNDTFFVTNGGIGIGSNITGMINYIRRKIRPFKSLMKLCKHQTYLLMLAKEMLAWKLKYYQLEIRCPEYSGPVLTPFIIINNQKKIAGAVSLTKKAVNDDGQVDVMIFTHSTRRQLLQAFWRIITSGKRNNDKQLISFSTAELEISGEETFAFFGDGEIIGESSHFQIGVKQKVLKVFTQQEGCIYGEVADYGRDGFFGERSYLTD